MKILNRLICLFKGHEWEWEFKSYFVSEFGYYEAKKCTRCGKILKDEP